MNGLELAQGLALSAFNIAGNAWLQNRANGVRQNSSHEITDATLRQLEELAERYPDEDTEDTEPPIGAQNQSPSNISVACLPCAQAHLTAAAAYAEEATRFLPDVDANPQAYEEIDRRMLAALKEILAMERFDWAPANVAKLPADQQEVVRKYQPQVRQLRQQMIASSIEDTSEIASSLSQLASQLYGDIKIVMKTGQEAEGGGQ
jgi:hypothetical protein